MRGKFRRRGRAEQRGKTEEDVDEYQKLADEELIQKLREGDERIMDYIPTRTRLSRATSGRD